MRREVKEEERLITSRNLVSCSRRLTSARIRCLLLLSEAEAVGIEARASSSGVVDDAVSDAITGTATNESK